MQHTPAGLVRKLRNAPRLWLFLDYDGTLADFAPTPDHVEPRSDVVHLVSRLAQQPDLRVTIVSGRRLRHVEDLVPVPGIILAGTYGIELRLPDGEHVDRVTYQQVRPTLDTIKPHWSDLLAGHEGFYLEDKGWALAIHARFAASDTEADRVLAAASQIAGQVADEDLFRRLGGHRFLEIGPRQAHKGLTIDYLWKQYAWPDALPVYIGDDDKDEEAFGVVQARGGIAIVVGGAERKTVADHRLEAPADTRRWLGALLELRAG